jgi:fluoroquinolone transport system ATP-binding protein
MAAIATMLEETSFAVAAEAAISVSDLTYSYAGAAQPAVKSLTFGVEPGEIFGFLGPSGAGKSTTQRILIRLLKGHSGAVSVMGRDLASWGQDYYEHIGVAFEFPNHFLKLTALENLAYFAGLYSHATDDPKSLLDTVGLGDNVNMAVGQFSKGMKTRLSVARAILHNPELLFLDEPTAGLDPVNSMRIRDLIREQKGRGRTVFLTTHDMAIADELCDRVAFIMDGRIRLIDAPRRLKLRYGAPAVRVEYSDQGVTAHEDFSLEGLGTNEAFLELLRGGHVQTMHTQEASLEDIFIRVTGRALA